MLEEKVTFDLATVVCCALEAMRVFGSLADSNPSAQRICPDLPMAYLALLVKLAEPVNELLVPALACLLA